MERLPRVAPIYVLYSALGEHRYGLLLAKLLTLIVVTMLVSECFAASPLSDDGGIPKYPDVWMREFPKPYVQGRITNIFRIKRSSSDDYLFVYISGVSQEGNEDRAVLSAISFFEGKTYEMVTIDELAERFELIDAASQITLDSKIEISGGGLDPRQPARCPQSLNNFINHKDGVSGIQRRLSLFYVIESPETITVDSRCAESANEKFQQKLKTITPRFIPLADGTFLTFDPSGGPGIIRFDKNFWSRTQLVGGIVYVLDTTTVEIFLKDVARIGYQHIQDHLSLLQNSAHPSTRICASRF